MATKSIEMIEEEDERMQSDIFAFLQQSAKGNEAEMALDALMDRVLQAHQRRAQDRLEGLKTFSRLLQLTESSSNSRLHVIPALATAFKRVARTEATSVPSMLVEKVHYLDRLEFAGPELSRMIGHEFFSLLSTLLNMARSHLADVQDAMDGATSGDNPAFSPSSLLAAAPRTVHKVVREVMLIFETCCIPYRDEDWTDVSRINLLGLLTDLTAWRNWKATMALECLDDGSGLDVASELRYPILPVGLSQLRCPRILCSRAVTIGTDLHRFTIAHHSSAVTTGEIPGANGGLAVFDQPLGRGRWYWEVSIVSQAAHPIFVGVASSPLDLNDLSPTEDRGLRCGVWLYDGHHSSSSEEIPAPVGRSLRLDKGDAVGLLLDCDDRLLGVYVDCRRIASVPLDLLELSPCAMYVALGLRDAEVYLNLSAPVPEKLWAASAAFRFPAPVVSGCLTATPLDGAYISWDAKARGRQLRLSADGTTVIAGDCRSSEDSIETVVATHAMESDAASLFAEVHVLSPGRDGVVRLAFGLVGADFAAFDDSVASAVDVTLHWPDDALDWGVFGVLFDVAKAKVTVYPSSGEPQSAVLDIATLKRPLLPAVSALCNGVVFATNFHPRPRPELPLHAVRPAGVSENSNVSSSSDIQVGKLLQMQVRLCDGGEFSASHAARNCLTDDSSVFSSAKGANVNLVLRHELDTPFCLSYLVLRGPGPGYSSPLRHAAVFVMSSMPDLRRLQAFDSLTPEEFACLPFGVPSARSDRDELLPVAYCVLDGSCAQNAKQLAVPVVGRYVVVKLLCPTAGNNIDVGYIGLYGTFDKDNGPAYAESNVVVASCDECKTTPLRGVFYSPRDDDGSRLCAACYDDNRGRIDACYIAQMGEHDTEGTLSTESTSTLCMPRKNWLDKIATQLGALRRHKPMGASSVSMDGSGSVGALAALPIRDPKAAERSSVWFDDCELFSCGQNNYGELCLGHCNSTSKLEHVPFFSGKSIREIAGGNEVLAVLARDGTLFTCGLNKSGQCGNGTFEERVLVATPVRALAGISIEMIAAANGCEHMLAVSTDGAVYSWGYNDRGQLGLGSTISKSHTPRLIESLRDKYVITYAAVSYHHSAVVTSAGELLTFGMNDCGQLGLDHTQHQHTPQLVDALASQVVTKVACGLYHTVVTTAGGELYAFGKNDYGQLGLGHARNVKLPTLVRVTIGDSDEKVVDVSCGYYHTVAVTDKGKLITWGRNDYGQLGIGSKDHKNVPQYVPLPLSSRIPQGVMWLLSHAHPSRERPRHGLRPQ
ncbi:hypothetical protein PINS_up000190 [Pythium insidiosum]|nr:hypothetical protein PINS_up000190 [Pythium insidiosum]